MPSSSDFDPRSNPLGTQNLEQTYLVAADNFVLSQLYANWIIGQSGLDGSELDAGLATAIGAYQTRMKSNAELIIKRLMPSFVTNIGNGFDFSGLVIGGMDRGLPSDMVLHLVGEAGGIVVDANSLNMNYQQGASANEGYVAEYDTQLSEAISRLSESAKQASSEIDALQEAIAKNLEDIVKGGRETGEAISDLTYTVLTNIVGAINNTREKDKSKLLHDSDDADQAEDAPDEDDNDPSNYDSLPDATASRDYTINAINAGSSGVATLSAARQALNINNEKLANAYQRLAQENGLITVAKVMQVQNKLFLNAFGRLGQSTGSLTNEWRTVQDAYSSFGQQLQSGNGQSGTIDLARSVPEAKALWNALKNQLDYSRKTINGVM